MFYYAITLQHTLAGGEAINGSCKIHEMARNHPIVVTIEGTVPATDAMIVVSNQSSIWDINYCLYPRRVYWVDSVPGNGRDISEVAYEKDARWAVRICGQKPSDVTVVQIDEVKGEFAC